MSDHKSEATPASPEVESLNGSFSSNGNHSGASAGADTGGQDLSFLDDLAKAMRTTAAAQQARDAELTDQRRQSHLDAIRAREALEAEELRELAKEDVKAIDAWSDGEIKRIKLERERRIASRREQLQVRLEEHRLVVASEVEAVEAAVASYRTETERFFDRLGSQTDPVEIARQAGTRPPFPNLDEIGPQQEATPTAAAQQAPTYEPPVYAPPAYTMSVTSIPAAPDATSEPVDATDAQADASDAVVETAPATEPEPHADAAAPAETAAAETAQKAGAPLDPAELIAVMDPDSGQSDAAADSPTWASDADGGDDASGGGSPTADAVSAGSDADDASSDESQEPVSVGAEARVVMPRTTTGAGSWLRWPNSSIDRSDPSR